MVGVPGRSKGCNTCIQRKIKCDQGRPFCGNCQKSSRLCTGYKRAVAFVMSSNVAMAESLPQDEVPEGGGTMAQRRWRKRTQALPRALSSAAKPCSSAARPPAPKKGNSEMLFGPLTSLSKDDIKRFRKAYSAPWQKNGDAVRREPSLVDSGPPLSLEALTMAVVDLEFLGLDSAEFALQDGDAESPGQKASMDLSLTRPIHSEAIWREQLFPVFLNFHLPQEVLLGCRQPGPGSKKPRNWLLNLPGAAAVAEVPALETAMGALCMARIGRRENNTALIQHSLGLYIKGLRQLQRALDDPQTQLLDQTLAACMAFTLYEVCECPSRRIAGYTSHEAGGLALLQKRGPAAHTSALGHSLFIFMRMLYFLRAIELRKSNFLSTDEWLQRPWQTAASNPQDRFMDQMYAVPVLLEQRDTLEASGVERAEKLRGFRALIAQHQALYACVQGWFADLQAIVAGPLYRPELSQIRVPVLEMQGRSNPFPVAFHFPAFSIGQSMILFWVVTMVVHNEMAGLYASISRLEGEADVHTEAASRWEPQAADGAAGPVLPSQSAASAAVECRAAGHAMVSNICQSVEYFFQDEMGDIGATSSLLPLIAVRHAIARHPMSTPPYPGPPDRPGEFSDEVVWIDNAIKLVGFRGQRMAFYLDS